VAHPEAIFCLPAAIRRPSSIVAFPRSAAASIASVVDDERERSVKVSVAPVYALFGNPPNNRSAFLMVCLNGSWSLQFRDSPVATLACCSNGVWFLRWINQPLDFTGQLPSSRSMFK
jgi:hypothetical protein